MNFSTFFPCFIDHLFFVSDFRQLPSRNFPQFFSFFTAPFASVIDPCSVNTAEVPEASFTISPRSTTRPLYFWCFVSNSAFFKLQRSISEEERTFMPFVLASSITSDLFLTFVLSHTRIFASFSHSLSTAAFAASIFFAWGIGKILWTKL